jgi:hypothetical protein
VGTQGTDPQTAHFGFRQVDEDEKDTLVASVFRSKKPKEISYTKKHL